MSPPDPLCSVGALRPDLARGLPRRTGPSSRWSYGSFLFGGPQPLWSLARYYVLAVGTVSSTAASQHRMRIAGHSAD